MKSQKSYFFSLFVALLAMNGLLYSQSMVVRIGSDKGADLGLVRNGAKIKIICNACVDQGHYWEDYHGSTQSYTIGPDNKAFSIDQSGVFMLYCSNLTPTAGYDTIRTSFHPSKAGDYNFAMSVDSVNNNAGSGGINFTAKVVDTLTGGYITVYPPQLKFDTLEVGSSSTLYLSITNTYLSSDTVTINVGLDSLNHFKLSKDVFTVILQPGEHKTYSVDFLANTLGYFWDTLIVTSNASQTNKPFRIPLSGFVKKPLTNTVISKTAEVTINIYSNIIRDKNIFIVTSNFSQPENTTLQLYDALGRQLPLPISLLQIPSGSSSQKLEVGNLRSGCYILRMKMKDQVISKSFIIAR